VGGHTSRTRALVAVVSLVAFLGAVAAAHGAVLTEWNDGARPPGYRLTAQQAIAIGSRAAELPGVRARYGRLTPHAFTYGHRRWQLDFRHDGVLRLEVHVDDRRARVAEVWTGTKLAWRGTRGSKALTDEGETGRLTNATWLWVLLGVLFVAPFVDPRRPLRMLHLDLALLLGLVVSHVALDHARVEASLWLTLPVMVYLVIRFGRLAVGGERDRSEPLVPFAPPWLLVAVLIALAVLRIVLNLTDSVAGDVAFAGVGGADRISHGLDLYTAGGGQYDTYGPVNYLLYWPFERIWPLQGPGDPNLWAAHAASITFDLLTAVGLFVVGARVRAGHAGRLLGLALAYAWIAYPFSWYALAWNTNDATVPMLLLPAVAALALPVMSGVFLGLAAAAKFVPALAGPLLVRQAMVRGGLRAGVGLAATAAVVAGAAVFFYLPDGGLREFYDATIGYQLGRSSPFSIWELHSSLQPVQTLLKVALVVATVCGLFWSRPLSLARICAWLAALIVLLEMTLSYWNETYVVWFAPFALVAAFASWSTSVPRRGARPAQHRETRLPAGSARL
jgi:hypothetical protein